MKVLVTGGAGYIGSTISTACETHGIEPVILDDLSTGVRRFPTSRPLYVGDVADGPLIDRIVGEHPDITAAVHCAAKVVVPESVQRPLDYYDNNVSKGIAFARHAQRNGIDRILFSSSAAIYAASEDFIVDESSTLAPSSPYANSKAILEGILRDTAGAGGPRVIALRYFNPIGADPALRSGPQTLFPTHVLDKLIAAWRSGETFTITGADWPTRDGSAIRDYIHVYDLAEAHIAALNRFDEVASRQNPFQAVNVGTGRGVTVKELVAAFCQVVGEEVNVTIGASRPGDGPGAYTRTHRARALLGWRARRSLEDGIKDTLAWASRPQVANI